MLNYIWLGMVTLSVAVALATGSLEAVGKAVFARAEYAVVELMLPLAGIITLWMGIMRLVEVSGLIHIIARMLSPVMSFLFPDVPKGHPALGSIAMNMGANMLGAGNAATPLGLRAMEQLNQLNPNPGVASNAMVMLLALNTSALTLIPTSTIGLLQKGGAANPTEVIAPTILASLVGTICAILICRTLQFFPMFRTVPFPAGEQPAVVERKPEPEIPRKKVKGWRLAFLALTGLVFLTVMIWYVADAPAVVAQQKEWYQRVMGKAPDGIAWFTNVPDLWYLRLLKFISASAVPGAIAFFVLYAALAGVKVYEQLVEGAKEGMNVVFRVIPYIVAMLVAIGMLTESGALRVLEAPFRWVLTPLGDAFTYLVKLVPMIVVRPMSGGAGNAVLGSLISDPSIGVDSLVTKTAAVMNGSTETTLYVAAVYFGSVGVRRMRHGIPTGLLADACAMIASIAFTRWLLMP